MITSIEDYIAPTMKQYSWSDGLFINPGLAEPIHLSLDRKTFFGTAGQTLYQSTNLDTAASGAATWAAVSTFPATQNQIPVALLELPDGEVMVSCSAVGAGVSRSRLYRSAGWGASLASRQAAVFTQVLETVAGAIGRHYSFNANTMGSNGVMLITEQGSQTITGGAAKEAENWLKARRAWVTIDGGKNFQQLFDIYLYGATQGVPYPANVHMHGCGYDEEDDRIYLCYGDGTGDGKNIAGTGFTQVVYSDDWREKIGAGMEPTWIKMPQPKYYDNTNRLSGTAQFITVAFTKDTVIFTPDVSSPNAPLVFPKLGYRKLGEPRVGSPMSGLGGGYPDAANSPGQLFSGGGIGGCPCCAAGKADGISPLFLGGQQQSMVNAPSLAYVAVTHNGRDWSRLTLPVPVQTPAINTSGFTSVYGPTVNGKVVAYSGVLAIMGGITPGPYLNNDPTKRVYVATLTGPT